MPTSSHNVARFSQLRDGHPIRVVVEKENVLLIRDGDAVHAYAADCPHAGAPLEEGAVCHGHIVCPWHKGIFALATGDVLEPPPLVALDRYPVTVEGDNVMVVPEKLSSPAASASARTDDPRVFAIIGAGAAGGAACAGLRRRGFSGRIVLIGKEPQAPYDRTSLSKFVLSGEMKPQDVPALLPAGFIANERIERIVSTVSRLDAGIRHIHFEDGRELAYDAALLAPGSTPVVPDMPGCDLGNVYRLRSLADACDIVDAVHDRCRVVILGSSFIGLESACALRKRNIDITVVSTDKIPFSVQFGDRIGSMFRYLHEDNGVVFRLDTKVAALAGESAVREVVLASGERLAADVVLLGTGVKPATGFVDGVALQKDGGITVDAGMWATPGLYVAGDIAVFPLDEGRPSVRIEHWRVAQQHGLIAARNMCGANERYDSVPFFWTHHYGKTFEYLGHASEWDEIVTDGDLDLHEFLALFVKDGKVVAALACGREQQTSRLIGFLRSGLSVDQALRIANGHDTGREGKFAA
ncbi:FAD-dependent oxidoreductase [Bordetella sp. FB-8]|uniref:FAD-dependent oxidoreductase n=1 Tax=Bordetella sp. FB-8 TaxID=1159870 RepID=UPI00039E15B0|nr:FAD-dependent oxidoreductase [Bordetella sp. FB-8]